MLISANVIKEILPNGLTVLVQRQNSAPVVAVVTHVNAGYFDEPDEWVGMAHVLEHMFFKGTIRRGPGEIARDTQSLGGYLNAGTIYDKTVYYTVLPSGSDGLERAIDIQSDALQNSALDAEELARELEVIIQEANRKLDSPNAVAGEKLYELLFAKHRMRRWRIGTEKGLRKFKVEDVRRYYTTRYTPGRVIVAVVGDVDVDEALALVRRAYGGWGRPTVPVESSPTEHEDASPAMRLMFGDVTRPLGVVGWRTVGTLHPDTPGLDVAASVLGAGRASRLYRDVRTTGLASSVRASHFTPTEVGVFDIGLASDAENLDDAVERSVQVVSELATSGPTVQEIDRIRVRLAMRRAKAFESMDSRAAALCEAEALGGYELVDREYERALAVTPDDVVRVVGRYLGPQRCCAVLYLPNGGASRHTGNAWPLDTSQATRTTPSVQVSLAEKSRESGNPTRETAEYDGDITRRSHDGIDMLVRSKRGCGLVSIGLDVAGLPSLETVANAGISRLLVRSTVRGAGGWSSEELAQAAEALGGGIVASSSADGLGWGITVPPESLKDAAELLRIIALEPNLYASDIESEKALQMSDARRSQDDMFRHPIQKVLEQSFNPDAYGLPLLGDPEIVESFSEDKVREWGDRVAAHRATVVAVGDLDREEMLDALAPLAGWPAVEPSGSGLTPPVRFNEGSGFEQRDKAQTAIAMAFPGVPAASTDRFPIAVMGTLLSGLAGRLFAELREKRSLAYTVAALPWLRFRAGAVLTYIAMSPDKESEARDEMLRELERVVSEPIAGAEIERARNYAAGQVELRQQNASLVGSEILTAWLNGGLDSVTETAEKLRAVTAEDLARVAKDVFGAGKRAEFVVRGRGSKHRHRQERT